MNETEVVLNLEGERLDEEGCLATSADLPGLVAQGRTCAEPIELGRADARILIEVDLAGKLPLPAMLRRALKRKQRTVTVPRPVALPMPA